MIPNTIWVIIDFALFIWIVCLESKKFVFTNKLYLYPRISKINTNLIYVLILIFCIYNKTGGDYFHYQNILLEITSTKYPISHMEYPYVFIVKLIGNNNFIFRFLIWSIALTFVYVSLSICHVNNKWGLFCFTIIVLISFASGRVALAYSMFYCGYLITIEKHGILLKSLGVCLIILSFFFHKSILLLLLIGIVVPFFRVNTRFIIITLLVLPLISIAIDNYAQIILLGFADMDGINYFTKENEDFGLASKLSMFIRLTGVILSMFGVNKLYRSNNLKIKIIDKVLFSFSYILLYISFILMSINFGANSVSGRIRELSYFPFSIVICSAFNYDNKLSKLVTIGLILIFISDIYYFLYMYYLKTLGLGI